jgi:limonene-1,2-epoxide hydrolase
VQVAWSVGIFARMRPKQVVQAWVEAFNRGNADEIAGFYTENAVNHQVVNEPVEGRAAIHAMFKREFGAAKMVCQIENLFEDGDWVILEWRDPLGLRGCGVFRIEANKIVFQRGYWDRLSFSKAHGIQIHPED